MTEVCELVIRLGQTFGVLDDDGADERDGPVRDDDDQADDDRAPQPPLRERRRHAARRAPGERRTLFLSPPGRP